MSVLMVQRLVGPELCVACFSCHEECAKGAVVIERRVSADAHYSIQDQLHWSELPPVEMD